MANGKVMTLEEAFEFVENVGRSELFAELDLFKTCNKIGLGWKVNFCGFPYFKAVCASLVALGYDRLFVALLIRDLLHYVYIDKKISDLRYSLETFGYSLSDFRKLVKKREQDIDRAISEMD